MMLFLRVSVRELLRVCIQLPPNHQQLSIQ